MQLILNGRAFSTDLSNKTPLISFLEHLSIQPETVVVEINDTLYKQTEFSQIALSDGDCIEVVHFVGGGAK